MIALLDIGHSRVKSYFVDNASDFASGIYEAYQISDLHKLIDKLGKYDVFYASVYKEAEKEILSSLPKAKPISKDSIPIETNYDRNLIGIDRLLCSFAAKEIFPDKRICIVDSGSLLTIDLVSKGLHLGGYILPNFDSLIGISAGILEQSYSLVDTDVDVLGKDFLPKTTEKAVFYGGIASVLGAISFICDKYNVEVLILTGGGWGNHMILNAIKSYFSPDFLYYEPLLLFKAMYDLVPKYK